MPTCSQCGAFVRNDAEFCSSCGVHFAAGKPTSENSEQAFNDYFDHLNDAERTEESQVGEQVAYKIPDKGRARAAAVKAPQAKAARVAVEKSYGSSQGIIRMAWEDLKAMPGWIGKLLILSLINLIPVLNFFVTGFVFRWGSKAVFGADPEESTRIFSEGAFVIGFFQWVVSLIWGVVFSLVGLIPIVGVVVIILAAPLVELCCMRLVLLRRFGAAFELGEIWKQFKDNFGGSMALYWLPNLVSVLVVVVFVGITSLGVGLLAVAIDAASIFAVLGLFGALVFLVGLYVLFVVCIGVALVVARAFGYWIARVMPEWADDARECGADMME